MAGATLALSLPPLEAMLCPSGAWADGSVEGPFFGVFFWANGLPWHAAHGAAQASGRDDWTPLGATATSPLLEPLTRHRVAVATGLEPVTDVPRSPGGQSDGHMRGFMVGLTGDRPRPEGFDHGSHTLTASRQTLDQYVARHPSFYDAPARFRSVHVGVSEARFHDYGHWNGISYNGPESLNLPITQPTALFDLLFSVPENAGEATRRARMLDAVLGDARELRSRLGAEDRRRLDAHLEHIHQLQIRLTASEVTCAAPTRPSDGGSLLEKTRVMSDLLALAVSCGLTRVFTFMLTSPASTHTFSTLGVPDGMHKTCHDGHWDRVRSITLHQMAAFGEVLDAFASRTLPDGSNLLDQGLIYGTSEYGEGWKHSVRELPVVLAGGAGGRLRRGVHVRAPRDNVSRAQLTAMRALSLPVDSFGWNGGLTTATLPGLLT